MIAGENRGYAAALAWLNPAEARTLLGRDPAPPDGESVADPDLLRLLTAALASHNENHGSATRIERLLVLARPAALDAGEVTDKGYVNQRRVLAERAALVDLLYADPPPPGVVTASRDQGQDQGQHDPERNRPGSLPSLSRHDTRGPLLATAARESVAGRKLGTNSGEAAGSDLIAQHIGNTYNAGSSVVAVTHNAGRPPARPAETNSFSGAARERSRQVS